MRLAPIVLAWAVLGAASPSATRADPSDESPGSAETTERATDLYGRAKASFEKGDHQAALDAIEASLALLPSPNSDLLRAHVLVGLGRRTEAMNAYARALEAGKKRLGNGETRFEATVAEASRSMGVLGASLAELDLVVTSPAAVVKVNGLGVDLGPGEGRDRLGRVWVEPGDVVVSIEEGALRETRKLALARGETRRFVLEPRRRSEPPPRAPDARASAAPPVASWALGAVGAAGFVTFAVFGGLALSTDAGLSDCSPSCPESRHPEASRGEAFQIAANVGVTVGSVALATAAIVWIVHAVRRDPAAAPTRSSTPSALTVRF